MDKYFPSNTQLNAAAAILCGWKWYMHNGKIPSPRHDGKEEAFLLPISEVTPNLIKIEGEPDASLHRVYGSTRRRVPNFCEDRNTLPELWAAVEAAEKQDGVYWHFPKWTRPYECGAACHWASSNSRHWAIATKIQPREHVIAALKACNAWHETWNKETEEIL